MKLIDLNLLIYAINSDAPHHRIARRFWETCLAGDEIIALAWVVILGFLRITTSARVLPAPLAPEQAYDLVDEWLRQPPVRIITPTERHWEILKETGMSLGTAGNLTTDAHLAALAIEHGATLYSADTDFARFAGLRWKNPLSENR
jgi:toxin-antitoxin system PIN domain toxin